MLKERNTLLSTVEFSKGAINDGNMFEVVVVIILLYNYLTVTSTPIGRNRAKTRFEIIPECNDLIIVCVSAIN